MPRKPSVIPPHRYVPDEGEPADHNGRLPCVDCRMLGADGDARHPTGARSLGEVRAAARVSPAAMAAGRYRDAAILGERDQ